MLRHLVRHGRIALAALAVWMVAAVAWSAPRIDRVSLRGLQAGGITTLVIEGAELLPEPVLHLTAPDATYKIKEGATPQRLEAEFTVEGTCPAGIYLLRAGSASGISEPLALGIDNLPQLPFSPQIEVPTLAMSGSLSGSTVLSTTIHGKKDQQVLVEVEAQRLGSKLDPVVHLYDARHTQLAWSGGLPAIGGDPRFTATLPADGQYTIELHDALFRGANPGYFRLKVGDFRYADLAFPLAVQRGVAGKFEFVETNLPADVRAEATLTPADGLTGDTLPAPWPTETPLLSGSRPAVLVTDHPEIVEAPTAETLQEIPAAPVAINGRLSAKGEQDRYRLAVKPGQQLRFDVLARRAGSALDGVLSIQDEAGKELAGNDDRPGTSDPGVDFKVPDGVNAVVVVLRDLYGKGGAEYLYRIDVDVPGAPSYSVSIPTDRILVPKDGAALVRVQVKRAGYPGPIDLAFPNLPPSVSLTGNKIPARATEALVTLSAPGLSPAQSLSPVIATSAAEKSSIKRRASTPGSEVTKNQPWLGDSLAVAVTTPSPIQLTWDLLASDAKLMQGVKLANNVRLQRAEGVKGAVRLSLLTTQKMPRKKVKENNQEREVDDVDRALRFEGTPTIGADQAEAAATVLVPGDLPRIAYDLAIQGELLGDDNKTVVATVVTPARRLGTISPLSMELASKALEARAGEGATGHIQGKITRTAGFTLPVNLTLTGLPKELNAPTVTLTGDQTDFDFPVSFPFGTAAGELKDVKVAAIGLGDPKDPKTAIFTTEVKLPVTVVPGTKPPEQPKLIFEDQAEFVASLTEGGGQATLDSESKYSGTASVKVTPDQKFNPALPGLGVKIRENPGPGEYRYLRFAWRKQGGQAICLQLNHDGAWGPTDGKPASFRYHAGPSGPCFGASLAIDAAVPEEFDVVTRDLFADFGEFTLNGIALSPVDGEYGQFDHIYLGTSVEDFKLVKP